MKNVSKLFNELRTRQVKLSTRAGANVISQKDLSIIKQELMHALVEDFKEILKEPEFVGIYENGVVVELENEFYDAFTFELNPKVKSLEFDSFEAVENFNREQKIKRERAEQRKKDRKAQFTNAQRKRKSTKK